jgi:hydroxypyruvate isomerase
MATQREIAARHSYARSLLERKIRVSSAATMISTKFSVSRSTAYEDLKIAADELDASDDGPAEDEPAIDAESMLAQLAHSADKAFATDDFKAAAQLIKAIDQVKRWNGYNTESANPFS